MRAILVAKATRTSIVGLRASIRPIHEPPGAPWRAAQRRTALAPIISRRRRVRSPLFEVAPSFCLPPVECWRGGSPIGVKLASYGIAGIRLSVASGMGEASMPVGGGLQEVMESDAADDGD